MCRFWRRRKAGVSEKNPDSAREKSLQELHSREKVLSAVKCITRQLFGPLNLPKVSIVYIPSRDANEIHENNR